MRECNRTEKKLYIRIEHGKVLSSSLKLIEDGFGGKNCRTMDMTNRKEGRIKVQGENTETFGLPNFL